jgi:hypothetical protein
VPVGNVELYIVPQRLTTAAEIDALGVFGPDAVLRGAWMEPAKVVTLAWNRPQL